MKRIIKKVAVLGSGVMGSRIACHFANIGVEVLLLDIAPKELTEQEAKRGLALDHPAVKNRIVNDALQFALKSNPSPIYSKSFAKRITTGNFQDDMSKIAHVDWIIEVVVERLDIKKQVFDQVEQYRKPGTLVSSNTSGIPIHLMAEGRADDFKQHFCGTHFFNPPRYLKLLEIIPTVSTKAEVIDFLLDYGSKYLGKTTVLAKDTPAFIANRVGVLSIMTLFHKIDEWGLNITEVDRLTGPVLGRPKSATFRTTDVVGLDTLVHVAKGLAQNAPQDEAKSMFGIPGYIEEMVTRNWLGSKSGQGFFKKEKSGPHAGKILALNLKTLEYEEQAKPKFAALEASKTIEDLPQRVKFLFDFNDKAGAFYRSMWSGLFAYVSNRIPEIADHVYQIDEALKAGFGWQMGPFEAWDAIGIEKGLAEAEKQGHPVAEWVKSMVKEGHTAFYRIEAGQKLFYQPSTGSYQPIPAQEGVLDFALAKSQGVLWKNSGTSIVDLGDGVIGLEFHTKMNTIGGEVLAGIHKAIDMAEASYKGLVIYNEGENFSAGANVGMIFMLAAEQEYDELNFAIAAFQKTMMRLRYSSIPVIAAPHGLTLGGGCELSMHSDKIVAHAETYIGLVEFGVGVIPGGGGTKEFALRAAEEMKDGDIRINTLRNRFLTIGQAKVATSAHEAYELGYFRQGIDEVVVSRAHQLHRAKQAALELYNQGYTQPPARKDIQVLGQEGLGIVYVGAHTMYSGEYITEHEKLMSEKLGHVLCGGDLSSPTVVSEQYLLDLERKTFLELATTRKSLERMQSLIKNGKILRN
ncbi:MAG TPA: 3-hydroxyacyl-CoA dehydrogenase NAD-binding domain-containing protein [Luteibaculaceae bacterium]|nr:3-hydroxyacyl-CoA dehydrogenase NAD-binding domain-containing protein [Luteibaculaceae bacterium]